ncbi:Lysosomal thioesterase PPT2 [Orchesella cincta]|uniref:palmitoyl-CoA hydrolase n=1 Tax=Orchesella cincta TaxID=48709 RepID=A0A1D2NA06_ORCCI|nr:Lysosomal thioesterase PPT2 [Orchesella cincta]
MFSFNRDSKRCIIPCIALVGSLCISYTLSYKPVVLIHGIFDKPYSLDSLMDRIGEKHPGTKVTILDKFHGWKSMAPVWFQVKSFKKLLIPIMEENPGGINVIGFSQGGLVARALIQSTNKHNVHTFISLSSPQYGQYGDDFLRIFFPGYVKETAWRFFYSKAGQMTSVGNYWRDPRHLDSFLNYSHFLPEVNNEVTTSNTIKFKKNFLKLQRLVLIGGPDDGVISPWQSSHFGAFDENEQVIPMQNSRIYKNDSFGLRTLDKLCKIVTITIPGIHHLDWHKNVSVIDDYIIPYLD